jgi:asparagine synthase (glutamine-hydrolysing)
MCGLSGIISGHNFSGDYIIKSIASIKYRGPDDTLIFDSHQKQFFSTAISGNYSKSKFRCINKKDESDCWFAFNRLSIVDLSHYAMQPFYENDTMFMMNGEIYNYKELKNQYFQDAQLFSKSDSEIAFKLFLKFGNDFVNLLKGMFTITIYDIKSKKLKVWRDRLGIKPFYYTHQNGTFIFSSEIKGILSTELIKKEINPTGLAYSMYLNTCPAPLTIYKNIYSLQAGNYLEFCFEKEKISIQSYWHLEYNENNLETSFKNFSAELQKICNDYYTSEVEKAIMISGGTDSGTLAYFYGQIDNFLSTVHIYDEAKKEFWYAENNSKNAGLKFINFEMPLHPDKEEIKLFLTAEEEPNTSPEPTLFLSKKAKELGVKILYNALGPDEIFGGYEYYSKIVKLHRYRFFINYFPSVFLPAKYKSKFKEFKIFGSEVYPFISRRLFSWEEICKLLKKNNFQIPKEHPIEFLKNQVMEVYPDFDKLPLMKKISYFDIFYYISSHHTFRSDQPSMKYGIEMRFPFLEHTFVEKYFNQKNTFSGIENELKPLFRKYVKNILSKEVIKMKKSGFIMPLKNWIQNSSDENVSKTWYKMGLKEIFGEFLS